MELILASGSPRRRELLTREGIPFRVLVSDAEEKSAETRPDRLVQVLAERKAAKVAELVTEDAVILGADTVVSVDGEILGKPASEAEAEEMIRRIRGRAHEVYTGVSMIRKMGAVQLISVFSVGTKVHVKAMTDEEVRSYVALGESYDKAGAYAIQGAFGPYIASYEGDRDNVIGLPVTKVKEVLEAWGFHG